MRPLGARPRYAHASNGISIRSQHNPHHSSFASNLARGTTCHPSPNFLEQGIGGQNPRTRWSRICVTPLQDGKNAVLREQLVEGEVGFLVPLLDFQAILPAIRGFGFPCPDAIACFGQGVSRASTIPPMAISLSLRVNRTVVERLLVSFPECFLRRDTVETKFFPQAKAWRCPPYHVPVRRTKKEGR